MSQSSPFSFKSVRFHFRSEEKERWRTGLLAESIYPIGLPGIEQLYQAVASWDFFYFAAGGGFGTPKFRIATPVYRPVCRKFAIVNSFCEPCLCRSRY